MDDIHICKGTLYFFFNGDITVRFLKERTGTYVTTLLLVFVRTRHTRFGNFVEKDETTSSEVWGTHMKDIQSMP